MNDPDIATWGEDTDRLARDAEIDSDCDEWGPDGHRFEEQETWDHRIVVGCNCGAQPSLTYLRESFNP